MAQRVTIPAPSDEDILAWTEENLSAKESTIDRRLKPLISALGLNLLDKDDAGRGARRGKSYVKRDYVRALLAHQATVRAATENRVTQR